MKQKAGSDKEQNKKNKKKNICLNARYTPSDNTDLLSAKYKPSDDSDNSSYSIMQV